MLELSVVEKYLNILQVDFIKNRIASMKYKNKTHVTLICDLLTEDNRVINREKLITKPLMDLECYDLIDKDKYNIDWRESILSILRALIRGKYRLYYHYNYLESSSYKINYEITMYIGSILNDPWGKVFCCWQTEFKPLERNEQFFEKEIVQ